MKNIIAIVIIPILNLQGALRLIILENLLTKHLDLIDWFKDF